MATSRMLSGCLAAVAAVSVPGCDAGEPPAPLVSAGAPIIATHEPGASRSVAVPDPAALAEILEHAPRTLSPRPTAPDGGTLVGTDSGVEGEELPGVPPAPSSRGLRVGEPRYVPLLSNPAIERAARAQIYWHLRTCTRPDGEPPPPESITLAFTLRPDGTVDPATVSASSRDDKLESVAECVVRTFSSIPFRGPAAARGSSPRVVVLWPSVD